MNNKDKKTRRKVRVRSKMYGTSAVPRLSVHKTNKYMYAQLIDDGRHKTLLFLSEKHLVEKKSGNKTEKARNLGKLVAETAKSKKITRVVFDKGAFAYHGRVKALAEGAREGGLTF